MTSNISDHENIKNMKSDSNPHILVTKELLATALKNDLGPEWSLVDFEIKDFTKKGDNYATTVTSVSCRAIRKGIERRTFYVVKLNPLRHVPLMNDMIHSMFIREGRFLMELAPAFNKLLEDVNYTKIGFPECVAYSLEKGHEVLLSKDLRLGDFTVFDRKAGMDLVHSTLLVKELAKFHAASIIFKSSSKNQTILEQFPFGQDEWLNPESKIRPMYAKFLISGIDISINITQHLNGYEILHDRLSNLKNTILDVYSDLVTKCPEDMRVVCHGDCWNNNIMFTHNKNGHPEDIVLLDLQLCRVGSLGLDLNYFFYTSLTGEVRNQYYNQLLSSYFREFEKVLAAADMEMTFTEDEFREEVWDKTLFGIINALTIMPLVICESEDAPDFESLTKEFSEGENNNFVNFLMNMSKNPLFKTRFMSILEDLRVKKII